MTDGTLKIGEYLIEGPGEYDIAGIGLHVFPTYCIVSGDGIQTIMIWKADSKIDSGELSVDIMVCLLESVDTINDMVTLLDPRVLVFADTQVATAVATHDGITVEAMAIYKVSQSALPADVRVAVLLT